MGGQPGLVQISLYKLDRGTMRPTTGFIFPSKGIGVFGGAAYPLAAPNTWIVSPGIFFSHFSLSEFFPLAILTASHVNRSALFPFPCWPHFCWLYTSFDDTVVLVNSVKLLLPLIYRACPFLCCYLVSGATGQGKPSVYVLLLLLCYLQHLALVPVILSEEPWVWVGLCSPP